VIATLIGVTLSAWLIPAFTRQWEDRQKARELKAAITDEIAAATSRTLNAGLDVGKAQQPKARGRLYDAAGDYWEPASLKIAMKVRADFSPEVAASWDTFAFDVRRYLHFSANASPPGRPWDPSVTPQMQKVVLERWLTDMLDDLRPGENLDGVVETEVGDARDKDPSTRVAVVGQGVEWMKLKTDEVTAAILKSNPAGFSTTRTDFLRDLLP
jgi:hypothetical protein